MPTTRNAVNAFNAVTTVTALKSRKLGAWRLLVATATVALAGGLSQAAWAAPHDGPGMHGGAGMGMMGQGKHIDRLLDAVNATPDQRAQIKLILQTAHADGAAQRDATRKLHEQSQALFAQPTVDARAVETVRQQMLAQHDQGSKRMTQVMLDVSRVLTPDQRKTLADRMAQRRAMMERHRGEREASERQGK